MYGTFDMMFAIKGSSEIPRRYVPSEWQGVYNYANSVTGASNNCFNVCKKAAPVAPSTTR